MIYRLLLLLTISNCAIAQKTTGPERFAATITADDLKRHLNIIAGAEMQGRNTPSAGLEKAADYIAGQFKKAGVAGGNKGSYRQTYKLVKDSAALMTLAINGKTYTAYKDYAPYFFQNSDIDLSFNDYVFAGYGIADDTRNDYTSLDVKDKLVVIVSGSPKNYTSALKGRLSPAYVANKIKLASDKGARAVIVITDQLPERVMTRVSYRPQATEAVPSGLTFPVFYISADMAEQISGENLQQITAALDNGLAPLGMQQGSVNLKYKTSQSVATASNVIGIVEGSDKKDEYLIITAHYDHVGTDKNGNIYYGADDDGSGTVSVMEIAEAFAQAKKAGKGPRRSVIFMTVSGEEKGLWGSEYYAANPVYPLNKTTADLNIDMIGRVATDYLNNKDAENYVYVIGDDKMSTDLTPITEMVNKKYTRLKLDKKFNDPNDPERIYYRSDHYNFAKNGVPAIFYFNGLHADYHQLTDTIDKINFELMAKRARLVFHTAWEMANREAMLKRDLKLPEGGR